MESPSTAWIELYEGLAHQKQKEGQKQIDKNRILFFMLLPYEQDEVGDRDEKKEGDHGSGHCPECRRTIPKTGHADIPPSGPA